MSDQALPSQWNTPPSEFSLAPFWFWNDALEKSEIARQMDEFQAHGVDAFVIHPRVGLPRDHGWMSRPLLEKMRFAIEQAKARRMWIILYDEGMYPSGSSSGQVVAENPMYQCRGLTRINLDTVKPDCVIQGVAIDKDRQPALTLNQTLAATVAYEGQRYAIIDRPIDAVIRGLHFINEDSDEPPEDSPPATDLLNPDAVGCFIRLVYERYYEEFGDYFGNVITAIFTDEPMLLGRPRETGIMPGTTDILSHVNDFLGYDFTPFLPALWDDDAPETIRRDYERAVENRLESTYYAQLYAWCEKRGIALTGHPAKPDATSHLRYFHIPGQDIVWRDIEPDKPSALEGRQSTQAKAASSAMLHYQRRRNANEFCGAYGHDLTFEEMRWLANWLMIRGCNLLIPHAFYYSVRGPRKHERPPDVGLHSSWWDGRFTAFARACRRLCWLNTDSQHVCHAAILGEHHHLPWRAASVCFQHQIDFNYLDANDLMTIAIIDEGGVRIGNQRYRALIIDGELSLSEQAIADKVAGHVPLIYWNDDADTCLSALQAIVPPQLLITPACPGLRIRQVKKDGLDWHMLFNETAEFIDFQFAAVGNESGNMRILDPYSGTSTPYSGNLQLAGHELRVIVM
jgi:hypothetical protein